jgi:CheY-like chemotaxis protein/anti-sigma regulatory factor (Ser/Thr protein kinase)
MAGLALETSLSHEQREYLEIVKSSADSLLALVNDILDVSKIESRKLKIDVAEFDPRRSIEETVRLLAPLASGKGLELFCHVFSDVPDAVLGDMARFRQIVINLIGNAIKFTERGEVVIRAQVDERTRDGIILHASISDTGVGIPREKQKFIFDRFSQADASAKRRRGGAGLGLTISAALAEMMGGRVWVESEVGVGSTFHFTLRLETAPGRLNPPHAVPLRGRHILVADGSATGRGILAEMLADLGCRATCVASGDAAREIFTESVALILAAVELPGIRMDGPVERRFAIVKPGTEGPPDRRWSESKICGYLAKPVWRADLIQTLPAHIDTSIAPVPPFQPFGPRAPIVPVDLPGMILPTEGMRILLAEDNPVNQKVAVAMLRKRGHRVQIANNGLEAFQFAKGERFDLILMDLQMPEMDGMEAVQAIREYEAPSGLYTPVIALTAHAMEGDREKCLAAGMVGHVSKPIISAALFEAIGKIRSGSSDAGNA